MTLNQNNPSVEKILNNPSPPNVSVRFPIATRPLMLEPKKTDGWLSTKRASKKKSKTATTKRKASPVKHKKKKSVSTQKPRKRQRQGTKDAQNVIELIESSSSSSDNDDNDLLSSQQRRRSGRLQKKSSSFLKEDSLSDTDEVECVG